MNSSLLNNRCVGVPLLSKGKTFCERAFFALVLLGVVASTTPLFGQIFSVGGRSANPGYFANRDGSLTVSYTVSMTGGNQLQGVVPYLDQPECLTYGNRQIFNITYLGHGSSLGNLSTSEIPIWNSNTEQTVWFNIHMYDNNLMCPATAAADLAAECLTFQLLFSFDGTTQRVPVVYDQSQLLVFNNPPTNGTQIVDVLWDTDPRPRVQGYCQTYTESFGVLVRDQGIDLAQVRNDNNRIYYGVNWSLNINTEQGQFNWGTALSGIQIPLSNDLLLFNLGAFMAQGLIDIIPTDTQIFRGPNDTFPLDEIGGSGRYNQAECDAETWNFWDITDFPFDNGTVRDGVGSIPDLRTLRIQKNQFNISYRSSALYLVNLNGCSTATAFGDDQNAEAATFTRFQLDNQGRASVTVDVPAAWKLGGDLRDGYSVRWFARAANDFLEVSGTTQDPLDSKALSADLLLPVANADAYQVIAQITHEASGSMVSVESPAHGFSYQALAEPAILFGDVQDDSQLNVGEILEQPLTFTNNTGFNLENVTLDLAFEGGSDAVFGFGTANTGIQSQTCGDRRMVQSASLFADAELSTDLWFKPLRVPGICNANNPYRFSITTSYELLGTQHSYTQYFEITPGCVDNNPHNVDLDGLVVYWGTCDSGGIRLPIFGDSTYIYRWFDSAESLCRNQAEPGVDTDFWHVPDLPQTVDVFAEVTDAQTGLARIYPLRVVVFENLPTREAFLPSWREETITDPDLDNDGLVTVLDGVIFFSAGGCD